MTVVKGIVSFITAVALAIVFVAAGLAACLAPPFTHALSSLFADDGTSPFSRAQLVQVADATRDYSFGAHDETALYRTIYAVDAELQESIENLGGKVPSDFPKLSGVTIASSGTQLKAAFDGASEMYCYSSETVSHLDDCYKILATAFPILIVAAAVALVGLVFTGVTGRKRRVGGVLLASGIVVIVAFVALGVWAALDFQTLFATFHKLFFSQGNWQFPYDSLLICALPTAFWMGMGSIWLLVSIVVSALSIFIGAKLLSRRRR